MEDVRIRFGKAVRNRRSRLGVSQEEFADMCGMDRTYIGGIERGERNLSLVNIEKIAQDLQGFPVGTVPWSLNFCRYTDGHVQLEVEGG
jgi:transcriptional regulator with XRE-family HTH domain